MANELWFSPSIPDELCAAIESYEAISSDLGNRVRAAFQTLFQTIKRHPEVYAVVYDDIRIARVKPFPFLVHYRLVQGRSEIIAIFPAAGDPAHWKRTTRSRMPDN